MKQQDQRSSLVAGANLQRLIKEAGMTQEQAAEKLGFSEDRQIRRLIKNGITKIDEIQRIADIFGVTLLEMIRPLD
jgi:transcriptional regulator with XRE-family HTH domain